MRNLTSVFRKTRSEAREIEYEREKVYAFQERETEDHYEACIVTSESKKKIVMRKAKILLLRCVKNKPFDEEKGSILALRWDFRNSLLLPTGLPQNPALQIKLEDDLGHSPHLVHPPAPRDHSDVREG